MKTAVALSQAEIKSLAQAGVEIDTVAQMHSQLGPREKRIICETAKAVTCAHCGCQRRALYLCDGEVACNSCLSP